MPTLDARLNYLMNREEMREAPLFPAHCPAYISPQVPRLFSFENRRISSPYFSSLLWGRISLLKPLHGRYGGVKDSDTVGLSDYQER